MVAISMYRGNLHRSGDDAARHWQVPPPTLSVSRFRRLLRSRNLAVSRLAGAPGPSSSPNSRLDEAAPEPAREAEEVDGDQPQQPQREEEHQDVQPQEEGEEEEEAGHDLHQQEVEEEGQDEQQQQQEEVVGEEEEQEEGAVEDVEMDDAGEVVVGGGDASANGNADPEEGQGESEGFDPNAEVRLVESLGIR